MEKKKSKNIDARIEFSSRFSAICRTLDAKDVISGDCLTDGDVLAIEDGVYGDILLSWGGPSDWLRAYVRGDEISHVEYHFADWFYHEVVELSSEEGEAIIRWIEEYGFLEHLMQRGS